MAAVLELKKVCMDFGGLRALDEVSLQVDPSQIVALIGPNGAGKTTLFNCVTGIYDPTSGEVLLNAPGSESRRVNGLKPNKVTELGMARTFQNIRLFPSMTVLENVMVGCHCRMRSSILGAVFKGPGTRAEERRVVNFSYELLQLVGLERWVNEIASNLPYGAQRRLEIARAMATEPLLVLLDEPAAGMNPQETDELKELIVRIRDTLHKSILLIEHDMRLVMGISDRIYVMEYGRLIAEGSPREISENPAVIKAYLGEEMDA
jgi:branched-chain amino acid transport system ATP-binding protein